MSTAVFHHIRTSMIEDVVLIEILSKGLIGPEVAEELEIELLSVASQEWAKRLLIDLQRTEYLSSTGFAVLVKLVKQAKANGQEINFCGMRPEVRIGADIVGMGSFVSIHDTEKQALDSFSRD